MKKEFLVERQGRAFVLYAGLLDMAHQQGLKSIRTELIQIPSEANNRVAICVATVVLEKDGAERVFTGIGDAAPNNVAPAMQTCLIRMAETRSKARALRDAVNVGVAALEELGEEDALDGAPERGYAIGPARSARSVPTPRAASAIREAAKPAAPKPAESAPLLAETRSPAASPITEAQLEAIRSLCRRRGQDADDIAQAKFAVENVAALTQAQASELIKALNERNGNGRAAAAA
ncbi:MAG TPA: hypothetical protein VFB38_09020 [Chthonomonadaceae bacterium]|nr:hypothetical protein [Chthonomonadaceae bacterium]